jgi:toxin ParE1/3/4
VRQARVVAPAREEFLAAIDKYNQAQPGLGVRFAAPVGAATTRALAFPLAGTMGMSNTRRVVLTEFPYSIIYRPEAEGIVIFAIAHQSRLPGYWRGRASAR